MSSSEKKKLEALSCLCFGGYDFHKQKKITEMWSTATPLRVADRKHALIRSTDQHTENLYHGAFAALDKPNPNNRLVITLSRNSSMLFINTTLIFDLRQCQKSRSYIRRITRESAVGWTEAIKRITRIAELGTRSLFIALCG